MFLHALLSWVFGLHAMMHMIVGIGKVGVSILLFCGALTINVIACKHDN